MTARGKPRTEHDREVARRNYEKHREAHKARCLARQREHASEVKLQRVVERVHLEAIGELGAAMTYEEIARALGISKARVGQLVASALQKLRLRNPELVELLADR